MLDEYREERMKEARELVSKAQGAHAKASEREKERVAFLETRLRTWGMYCISAYRNCCPNI